MLENHPVNPFHPEAVTTYGQAIKTCEDLKYIRDAEEQFNQYLSSHPDPQKRYGAAIGLRGGHGSGKTHLLNWLSQQTKQRQRSLPIVLYAKADGSSFFDLYIQLLSELSREKLQLYLAEALRTLALEQVGKAQVTESISTRIQNPDDVLLLSQEGILDRDQLLIQLRKKLDRAENPIPSEIPRMLLLMDDPNLGEAAYQWLLGKEVSDPSALGLKHQFRQLGQEQQGSAEPDITAINALETIAALICIAQRPLLVLIDQLEVLLRTDLYRQQTLFSVLKKMIEQLNHQNVLTFIAGNDESWEVLPRDVTPRLRFRQPIEVGHLTFRETKSLLESYLADFPEQFNNKAIETIYALSGGNPREIIRIAYYAYETVQGELSKVDEHILVDSAKQSHTIDDRNQIALCLADSVLEACSDQILSNLNLGDDLILERLTIKDNHPCIALTILKATDKLTEISAARQFGTIREHLEKQWASVPLIAVAVGYSSHEVNDLISKIGTVFQFDEKSFASQLKAKVAELLAQQPRASENPTSELVLLEALDGINQRLDSLANDRTQQVNIVNERLTERLHTEAEQLRRDRELRTRWELQDQLVELEQALHEGLLAEELGILRSILIANESYLKIKQVDYLGGLYIDVLSEERSLGIVLSDSEQSRESRQLHAYRVKIIKELRRLLRRMKPIDYLLEKPLQNSLAISLVVGIIEIIYLTVYLLSSYRYLSPRDISRWLIETVFPTVFVTAFFITSSIYVLAWLHNYKWERLEKLQSKRSARISSLKR